MLISDVVPELMAILLAQRLHLDQHLADHEVNLPAGAPLLVIG